MFKCYEHILYLSILEENYVDSQIPQNRMWIIEVPAVVHVPIFVLGYYAGAKSRNAKSVFCTHERTFTMTLHTKILCAFALRTSFYYKCVIGLKIKHTLIFHRQS